LTTIIVNGFLNAGYGNDKLFLIRNDHGGYLEASDLQTVPGLHWTFNNKDQETMVAAASLGLISMWDHEEGLIQLDKYLCSSDNFAKAGSLLGIGIVNSNVRSEMDPALALLSEYVTSDNLFINVGAIIGIGIAYAGTARADVKALIAPIISNPETPIDVAYFGVMSLGLVFVASKDEECANLMVESLSFRSEKQLAEPFGRLMCLGLGLIFLGHQDAVYATIEIVSTFHQEAAKFFRVTLEGCAYMGTGNLVKVQEFLSLAGVDSKTVLEDEWKSHQQSAAVLGVALLAMGEALGSAMVARIMEHLLKYGGQAIRKAVPVALGLLHVSNPEVTIVDMLSRLSHDTNVQVVKSALVALGIVGAGTNNARLASILRNLSSFYAKDAQLMFLLRSAEGLVHMGKGLLTIHPHHTDRQIQSKVGLAGLIIVLFSSLPTEPMVTDRHPYLLYYLVPAMYPRTLMTLNEEGNIIPTSVRVGPSVDVVTQAGYPNKNTGFQSYSTPVLLAVGERAELATEQFVPLTAVLEGLVIIKKKGSE
jgi:26S proteasome regulatory subunit N1